MSVRLPSDRSAMKSLQSGGAAFGGRRPPPQLICSTVSILQISVILRRLAVASLEKAKQIVTATSNIGVKRIFGTLPFSFNTLPLMGESAWLGSKHQAGYLSITRVHRARMCKVAGHPIAAVERVEHSSYAPDHTRTETSASC